MLIAYFALRTADVVRIYAVETGSMEDKIHTGDYILLYKKGNYKVNDVVTYTVDNYFITHRIIKIENGLITTKGDANNIEDKEIRVDQIIGRVIYCGGILNIIINFKFAIAAALIGLYLLSCYFEDEKEDNNLITEKNSEIEEIKDDEIEIIDAEESKSEETSKEEIIDEKNKEETEIEVIKDDEIEEVDTAKSETEKVELKDDSVDEETIEETKNTEIVENIEESKSDDVSISEENKEELNAEEIKDDKNETKEEKLKNKKVDQVVEKTKRVRKTKNLKKKVETKKGKAKKK